MNKALLKKRIVIGMLIFGLLPFMLIAGCLIYDAFDGVAEFSLFIPPNKWYYGLDAIRYELFWVWVFMCAYWYISIPWVVIFIAIPIGYILFIRSKE